MSDGGGYFGGDLGDGPGRRRVLPGGFADVPGGPRLAVLLASVDRGVCNGFEVEERARAWRRLIGWAEAECLAEVNELAYAEPGMPDEPAQRSPEMDPMTQAVLEPLLRWSGYHASWYLALALTLPRLPRTRAALASGQLELPDVRAIVDRITDAKPDLWDAIEDAIFPKVLELRGGLLRAKVEAEVVKADPEAAGKRHRAARTGRNVAIWPAVDGVADLAIRGLSADQAAEAYGYIDAIARAVKSAGDPRKLSQLRADVAYSLLSGSADLIDCSAPVSKDNHADQGQSTQDHAAQDHAAQDHAAQDHAAQSQAAQDEAQDDSGQDDSGQQPADGDTPQERAGGEQVGGEQVEDEPQAQEDMRPASENERAQDETGQGGEGRCAVHRFPDHDLHDSWCECGNCAPAPVASCSVCGTAAMNGVRVHDTAAHEAAARNAEPPDPPDPPDPPGRPDPPDPLGRPDPPDPLGRPDPPTDESTPPPPPWTSSQPSWGPIKTRAKVQLNMPLTTLMGLSTQPGELGGVGPIITEVARRIVANHLDNPEARFSVGVTHPVTGRLLHLHPIPARFLRGLQAELVHARDQRCVWTTCRRPAATCHLDHNTEYADGGETSVDNIAPLCPRHHKAKTERDWKLKQTGPGEHSLTDPFGRQYHSGAPSLTDPVVPAEPEAATAGARRAEDDLPPF
ncbi:HNH endonuclease [Actinopolymorpha cephalotaxi]|uniref:HNH endonuclease n=1 Tax=Actinopolymorpha cephalotaxi TaxID=504797 RepID=A0A1I2WQR4_9ACTN|nr:HNH endonuclease signature motif containing protein [Actinopolymorpha cephalotaxi]SFH02979.1 HNH endonuclease [Actinopolymorpha cephalotaxi]